MCLETPTKPGVLFSEEENESVDREGKSLHALIAPAKIRLFAVGHLKRNPEKSLFCMFGCADNKG